MENEALNNRLTVVLVRPMYARNVGLVARAMANLGVNRLVLIGPQCELDEDARQGAAGAQTALRNSLQYRDWNDFFANEGAGLRIAFSRREGRLRPTSRLDRHLRELAKLPSGQILNPEVPLYFIFGPEDDGLNSADLELANSICELPVYGDFKSYNLSHAVVVALLIVRQFFEDSAGLSTARPQLKVHADKSAETNSTPEPQRPSRRPAYFPEQTIDRWVEEVGFDLSAKRVNAAKIFKRILLENAPSEDELRVLEAILQQNIRKLRQQN